MNNYLKQIETKILSGEQITYHEALGLVSIDNLEALYACADKVCKRFHGNKVDLCAIMNIKSGKCSENCKFCAQSVHYQTGAPEYPLVTPDKVLAMAKKNEGEGVHRFAVVTSGRGISGSDFESILTVIRELRRQTRLKICASLGMITFEQAIRLKEAGLERYHHNLETCREYFGQICQTHSYQERINTIQNVTAAGLEVCCGGIIGLGETWEQRIKMAFEIRELNVRSVPVNILNPIQGTPLGQAPIMQPPEILKTMAIYRLILPNAFIRYAGGRGALGDFQVRGFKAGVNAALVGNFLTTIGSKISDDLVMIKSLGLEI